ncbi:MAG: DUF4105 domain-containing protein [Xanthomonadales bacterium]|nr:DUF4105 domain-containing protein [Xanthomonadales bacterium]
MLCCLLLAGAAHAQELPSPPEASLSQSPITNHQSPPLISLLTIGPGDIYFERFGHNAIVVRDPATGSALAYNYGMFDFEEEDFLWNFVRGRMRYRIAANGLADDLAMYRAEGRSIVEQHLDFTAEQAAALAGFLAWNARPENAFYRYDYFTANCSTRVRDALDEALGGRLKLQSEGRSRGYTYRLDALRLMAPQPALMLLIDLGLGPFADQRIDFWQESFVPMTLQQAVAEARLGGGAPLVAATDALAPNHVAEPPLLPPDLRVSFLLFGLALGGGLWWCSRQPGRAPRRAVAVFGTVFELVCGLGGLLLLFLWLGTEHRAAWRNENLLLLSPLCLLLVPAWLPRRPPRWAFALAWLVLLLAAFALFSKILPWFVQANLAWILLLLPIHLALALDLSRRRRVAPEVATRAETASG